MSQDNELTLYGMFFDEGNEVTLIEIKDGALQELVDSGMDAEDLASAFMVPIDYVKSILLAE